MWIAPVRSGHGVQKMSDYKSALADWFGFVDDTRNSYGVDMDVLTKPFTNEQQKYYLQV